MTSVNEHTAIYDLTPVAMRFTNRVVLRMKSVIPVLIDREAKTVTLAVGSAPPAFEGKGADGLDLAELTLSGSPATTIAISGNKVSIDLR